MGRRYSACKNDLRGVIRYLYILLGVACLNACTIPSPVPAPNRWADERLWPVLEAQEQRDTDALCALLTDEAPEVREAAALAFASVQDSASIPCLIQALADPDVDVRVNAVFALGFIANDSTVERMAERADLERDSTVHRAYMGAIFINLQRRGSMKDILHALSHLERSLGHERVRAADALRRLSPPLLLKDSALVLHAVTRETDPEVKAALIRALAHIPGPKRLVLLLDAGVREQAIPLRISAIQTLAFRPDEQARDSLFVWLDDPVPAVRTVVVDALHSNGFFSDGGNNSSIIEGLRWIDQVTLNRLRGLMANNPDSRKKTVAALRADTAAGPYAEAERIKALGMVDDDYRDDRLEELLYGDHHPAIRQAAFGILADRNQWLMMMPRAMSGEMQVQQAAPFWHGVFGSGDPGLICAAAERLAGTRAKELRVLFPPELQQQAEQGLHALRDLEALLLLKQLAAARDDISRPPHATPPFNHPINRDSLRALKHGQRYQITTTKGTIIIATDVNEAPGSSLAFDSLVTAGYYNGKAFHRMVPNFVVQGGCPRGDGYGGMPWTLRTEIGRKLFTAGSVGLASAGRDTESCQFFITHSAAPHLDGRYTRFGEVVEGMDVVWRLQVGDVMERVEPVE